MARVKLGEQTVHIENEKTRLDHRGQKSAKDRGRRKEPTELRSAKSDAFHEGSTDVGSTIDMFFHHCCELFLENFKDSLRA